MQYAESVVDLVGNTPLVRLRSVTRDLGPDAPLVLAKLEYLNPGGSVKDRIAVRMVDAAEQAGLLRPGDLPGAEPEQRHHAAAGELDCRDRCLRHGSPVPRCRRSYARTRGPV